MTYDEVKRFLHKKIIVTDIDGNRIKGYSPIQCQNTTHRLEKKK